MQSSRPFNLVRWFATLAFVCIAAVSTVTSLLLSGFLERQLMRRDAEISRAWVESITNMNNPATFFAGPLPPARGTLAEFLGHVASLPDVLRANAYSRDKEVLWSTELDLIGNLFPEDLQLDEALQGRVGIGIGDIDEYGARHPGQASPVPTSQRYVELTLPVRERPGGPVIGVVELYRPAETLIDAIRDATMLVWACAMAGGMIVFAALFWLIRRASRAMAEQQRRLVEAESLAVAGEMSALVAHGVRNPLAGIRSSAELMAGDEQAAPAGSTARAFAIEVMDEADRLEQWVRALLASTRPVDADMEALSLAEAIVVCLKGFSRELQGQRIAVSVELPEELPQVRGDRQLLGEVLNNIVSNAIDAMRGGGSLNVRVRRPERGQVVLELRDSGVGIPAESLNEVFTPFYTTKAAGVGLGLPLAQRILRRFGGELKIQSRPGAGTTVTIHFPEAK